MKTILTGGSGLLGQEILKLDSSILAPIHSEFDITNSLAVNKYLDKHQPSLIIHAAAVTNSLFIDMDPREAIAVNIQGSANLARACINRKVRLVYISTDYVYRGDRGNYREQDEVFPSNLYAWTKLGGESSIKCVSNHLIIRTSFSGKEYRHPNAIVDKWSSQDYVNIIAPQILKASEMPVTGILNIGSHRRTIFEFVREKNPNIKPVILKDIPYSTPYDTSLNIEKWAKINSTNTSVESKKTCRVCSSKDLSVYLDLGLMPIANNLHYSSSNARQAERYPLQVSFCQKCSNSQLTTVVNSEKLYSYYTYRSSVNPGFIKHCRNMARTLGEILKLEPSDLCLDIAGNDGALLHEFRDELKVKVLNIEPAGNISAISAARQIPTINDFWSKSVSEKVIEKYQKPKLITATNVFAHVDDIHLFLKNVKHCLNDEGLLVLEFPYLVDLIKKNEFDTIYFEHLSYFPISSIVELTKSLGMTVVYVKKLAIHGGSVRVHISPNEGQNPDVSVNEFFQRERKEGYHQLETYLEWAQRVDELINDLTIQITKLKVDGARIAAFGASAKGNTLLNACLIGANTIDYIVDDTPEKIGKFSPGTGIPIVNRSYLYKNKPDYLVILAWNFTDDILKNTAEYRESGGKYIIPIPNFRII